jgi:hypothetical protein
MMSTPPWVARARAAARAVAASADSSAAAPPTLSLISWNLQLLSVSVGTPAQLAARAARIGAKLLALSADVVFLQEVWDAKARAVLIAALSPAYAHIYAPADAARCGLVIASREAPLAAQAFHRYAGATGAESWLFDKGAAGALVLLGKPAADAAVDAGAPASARGERSAGGDSGGGDDGDSGACGAGGDCLVIINTHTQSDYWSPSERCAAARQRVRACDAASARAA